MFRSIVISFLGFFCVVFLTGCSDIASEAEITLREETEADYESTDKGADALEDIVDDSDISRDKESELFVYVCGAVNSPGVYTFANGTRIYEAINTAGGFRTGADESFLNLAEAVNDGQRLYVPTVSETSVSGALNAAGGTLQDRRLQSPEEGLVNINTAGLSELTTISGIGESRASDIISYRENNGAFSSIEDIMKVPGIKDGLFNKIKDKITV
ncbi:MAG: helix-hairpin-helix domain-containing protein [Lachnospiraceae bacterium]|nr:helix-hairpin-helix domain-containing protein [Lachnospiraceae bacterium]